MTPREAIPTSWTDYLTDHSVGLGLDLATSDKKGSNPSSLSVTQKVGRVYKVRLLVAWKTEDPDVTKAITSLVINDIIHAGKSARRLSIDASNEVFFARELKKLLRSKCAVSLVKSGENIKHDGHELDAKTIIGNIYINALEDGQVELPEGTFIATDHRLVKRDRGSFTTDTGKGGQHGDTFDSTKLSIWSLIKGGGKVQAQAVDTTGKKKSQRRGVIGPIGNFMRRNFKINS